MNLRKCIPGSTDSKGKGPEAAMSVARSRTSKEAHEAGAKSQRLVVRRHVTELPGARSYLVSLDKDFVFYSKC